MNRGAKLFTGVSIGVITACSSGGGAIQVRPHSSQTVVAGVVADNIAEARTQFALGNTGLAHELFRKALREQPDSLEAHAGIAACYERMGRFDLAARYYESALARSPNDFALLERFATALDAQGLRAKAVAVRAEIQDRKSAARLAALGPLPMQSAPLAALEPSPVEPVPVAALKASPVEPAPNSNGKASAEVEQPKAMALRAAPAPPGTVTVRLPAPEPVSAAAEAKPTPGAELDRDSRSSRRSASLRLERLSSAEVALVAGPIWKSQLVAQTRVSSTVRFVPLPNSRGSVGTVRLLNAARHQGLAAQTRSVLMARGWRRIAIGDAPIVRTTSVVLYPQSRRRTAQALAAQFGMTSAERASGSDIIMLLGRDAVRLRRGKDRA